MSSLSRFWIKNSAFFHRFLVFFNILSVLSARSNKTILCSGRFQSLCTELK
jgi:hypothetical protein